MTNEEKYKTQSERATAFTAFCKRFRFCKNCPARVQYTADTDIISDMDMHCHFKWLTLEYKDEENEYKDEEKPLPCPCCGATAMVREMPWPWGSGQSFRVYKVVCARCGLETGEEATPDKAVALWNRRTK